MNEKSKTAETNGGEYILQEIEGIGPGYAKSLDEISVHSFADLAAFDSPEDLHQALLDKTGVDIPLWKIAKFDWIGQAKVNAATLQVVEKQIDLVAEDKAEKILSGMPSDPASPDTKVNEKLIAGVPGWDQHAAFSVFFLHKLDEKGQRTWQTHVYNGEEGKIEAFSGVDAGSWVRWIFRQADLPFDSSQQFSVFVDGKAGRTRIKSSGSDDGYSNIIKLSDLQLVLPQNHYDAQIEIVELNTAATENSINGERIDVALQITGPEASELASDSIFMRDYAFYLLLDKMKSDSQKAYVEAQLFEDIQIAAMMPTDEEIIESEQAIEVEDKTDKKDEPIVELEQKTFVEVNRLEIVQMKVSEIGPSSEIPEKQLLAQVTFKLLGLDSEDTPAALPPYRVEIHTVNLESGKSNLVSSVGGQLRSQMFEYANRLKFALPEVGRYRIYCMALLLPPGELSDYQEGPILNII